MDGPPAPAADPASPDRSPADASSADPSPGDAPDPSRVPAVPAAADLGKEVRFASPRPCAFCGHVIQVARVVRLEGGRYDYACQGCAVKTDPGPAPDGV